jgi:hypothetical protein
MPPLKIFVHFKTINMGKNEIDESQQLSDGVTIGTSGNNDMTVPHPALKGGNSKPLGGEGKEIPNQDRSSATNKEKAEERGKDQ